MTARVLRHEVPVDGEWHEIEMNRAQVLHVASRRADVVEFWAMHTAGAPVRLRRFQVFGTGQPTEGLYVGTTLAADGLLVWHLFEEPS